MQSWIVSYDIADPKRLRRVARCCEDYGVRRQKSVFLCRLSLVDFARLRARLYDLLELKEDQVLFFPLCGKCVMQIEAMGLPTERADVRDVVIVS